MRKQEIGEKSMNLIEKVFGTHSERELKLIRPIVDKILGMREQMVALSDDELRDNTRKFKERLANGETLDDLLPEAFATVREAARRVLNMEHYPVQLIGGIVLHQGRIAEMRTGEGKTLVSTAPAYRAASPRSSMRCAIFWHVSWKRARNQQNFPRWQPSWARRSRRQAIS